MLHDFRGPPALLLLHLGAVSRERFSAVELTKEYIKARQIDEAVSLLSSQNWDTDGAACYSCLSAIVNHLLRQPLNADREGKKIGVWRVEGMESFTETPELNHQQMSFSSVSLLGMIQQIFSSRLSCERLSSVVQA